MDKPRDYYELLHVSRSAPTEVIRASYRTMMQQLRMHPDLGGDSVTAAMLNEAYNVLSDPGRRAEYDAELPPGNVSAEDIDRDMPVPEPPSEAPRRPLDPARECIFCFMPHAHGHRVFADARCVVCKSPLAIAEQQRLENNDARAVARIDKQQPVDLFTHWPQATPHRARTEDVSLSGVRLLSPLALQEGQVVRIRCAQFESLARVVTCAQVSQGFRTHWVVGLAFITRIFTQSVGGFVSHRA